MREGCEPAAPVAIAPSIAPNEEAGTLHAAGRFPRAVRHTMGLVLAALATYFAWRGYQTPEFLLDLANWRLC